MASHPALRRFMCGPQSGFLAWVSVPLAVMSDSPETSDAPNKPIGDVASPDARPSAMTERFNVFFRFFARRFFKHFSLDEDVVERLKGSKSGRLFLSTCQRSSHLGIS